MIVKNFAFALPFFVCLHLTFVCHGSKMYSVWCTLPQFFLWASFHDNRLTAGVFAFLRRMAFFVLNISALRGKFANFTPVAHLRHPFDSLHF